MNRVKQWGVVAIGLAGCLFSRAAERINHEGRILGPLPFVTNSILFNTTNADAVVAAMQVFPRDHAWNEDISRRPVLPNSDAMMNYIISSLATNRRAPRAFYEMNFVLVPDNQPHVPIGFDVPPESYGDESEPSPYPFAPNTPVETWPRGNTNTLENWQRQDDGSDRHAIVVMPGSNIVWETWRTLYTTNGPTNWHAASGARWNLNTNALRPLGWTSADAAGLSMFGGLVRFDECERGMIEHALRLVVRTTRHEYVYPATHRAGATPASNTNAPAMGQRLRLKSSFNIPTNWSTAEKAVLRALKKYGAIVADNGGFFSISVVPDQRFSANAFSNFQQMSLTNFEVVVSTVATNGPRSPGAPIVNAGQDRVVSLGSNVALHAIVAYTNPLPLTLAWRLYSGPTNVTFSTTNQTNTIVSFTTPGTYTFLFSAENGLHTPAYDAVIVTVTSIIRLNIERTGTNVALRWSGGSPPFRLERTTSLTVTNWNTLLTTNGTNATLPVNTNAAFYRVVAQ
jgi:hypothetical protein